MAYEKAFLHLALLAVSFIATAQTRVVVLSDFPPVDVVPGGMGFGDAHKRSDSDDVQSMVRVYLIGLQDGSAQWMLDWYPNLFAIISQHNITALDRLHNESKPVSKKVKL